MKKVIKIAATKLIIIAATIMSLFFVMGFSFYTPLKVHADNLTGETWVISESPSLENVTYNISFMSNNESYDSLTFQSNGVLTVYYNTTLVYGFNPMWESFRWINENYRTITFEEAPTGDLLTWLQANAVKQEQELGYEVTFVTNGGTSVTKLEDVEALPTPLPATTKVNNIFVGWFYDSEFEEQAFSGDTISSNITLYAKWHLDQVYINGYNDGFGFGYLEGYVGGYDVGYSQGGIDVIDIGWFRTVMSGIAVIFSIKVFGDITLATFIGIPLLFAIILWIKKLLS